MENSELHQRLEMLGKELEEEKSERCTVEGERGVLEGRLLKAIVDVSTSSYLIL